jgi:hypothetical protein
MLLKNLKLWCIKKPMLKWQNYESNEKPSMVDKPGNILQNHLLQRSTDADRFIGVD